MKVCAGVFLVLPPHPPFFRGEWLERGALRPELVDCYWLIKPSRSVLERREGFLHNEREAKLAVSFDPEGIKTVLLMEVERSGLPVSLSVCLMYCWERYTAFYCAVRGWVPFPSTCARRCMVNSTCSYNTWIVSNITPSCLLFSTSVFSLSLSVCSVRWVVPQLFVCLFLISFQNHICVCCYFMFPVCLLTVVFVMHHKSFSEGNRSEIGDDLSVYNKEGRFESVRSFWYDQPDLG